MWDRFTVYLDVQNTSKICWFLCFKIIISNQREVQNGNNRKFMYYTVCISYKKKYNKVKQSEVQTDMPQKFNYFTQCKNSTSKTEWSSNRHAPEVQLLHAVHFRSRWTQKSWYHHFSNLLKNGRNIICVSSSPRSEKVKKNCETGSPCI